MEGEEGNKEMKTGEVQKKGFWVRGREGSCFRSFPFQ